MIDTPFKALADAYTAMRLERDHLKARIATLEAALRAILSWVIGASTKQFADIDAARAALSPSSADRCTEGESCSRPYMSFGHAKSCDPAPSSAAKGEP